MAEKPEDLNLPTAVITRMIKEVLPEGVNISKEARSAISKSASVFVLYATSCANNNAMKHKRKTLTAGDVFEALKEMEFEQFLEPLEQSLEAFKKEQQGKKDAAELKRKQKIEAAAESAAAESTVAESNIAEPLTIAPTIADAPGMETVPADEIAEKKNEESEEQDAVIEEEVEIILMDEPEK